jgi:uncharacterized membrane protein
MIARMRPEVWFVVLALIFGVAFTIVTPPFQGPDEPLHLLRAYSLSEGKIVAERRGDRVGADLPASLREVVNMVTWRAAFYPQNKISLSDASIAWHTDLEPNRRRFTVFLGSAWYSPVPYIPQTIAMLVGRVLDLSPLRLMYLGRVFSLLAWVGLVLLAIRVMPHHKWLLAALALTPMCAFLSGSVSADCVTDGIAFLIVASFLKLAADPGKPGARKLYPVVGLLVLLALCKPGYMPLALMFLVLPVASVGSTKKYALWLAVFIVLPLAAACAWAVVVRGLCVPYKPGLDQSAQLSYILHNPFHYLVTLCSSIRSHGRWLVYQMLGRQLGWVDTVIPSLCYVPYIYLLLLLAMCEQASDELLKPVGKIVLAAISGLVTVLIFTALYLTFNPLGAKVIAGVQGRYFTPIAPLVLLLFCNRRTPRFFAKVNRFMPVATVCLIAASLTGTLVAVYARYYP